MQSSALVSTQSSPRHRFLNVTQKKSDEDKDHFHSAKDHSFLLEEILRSRKGLNLCYFFFNLAQAPNWHKQIILYFR